jgi:hypothetical protein
LLASAKSREAIAGGIKTEKDTQNLAAMCIIFLNKTWLDSPTMRPFEGGVGDQRHVLTYNQNRMKALSVTVTATTEVLATLGHGGGTGPVVNGKINGLAQKALESIFEDLNERVFLQNVTNESVEAKNARKQIAQLKLYLACQQDKFVGGPENLAAKWCANVIASLAECRDRASDSLQFSEKVTDAELRHFCSEFAM